MFIIIFTSDYEIHGNGEGSPMDLIVEPTSRMLELFDKYNAKLTIMADIAELIKFKEHNNGTGSDDFYYKPIIEQLKFAIKTEHDVQLHLHPSYFKATYKKGRWEQNYNEYDLSQLDARQLKKIIKTGKSFLESELKPVKSDYSCFAFRAANWSMQPSFNAVNALIQNNIIIDTSVFKYGRRDGLVKFNYSNASSDLIPWPVDSNDICKKNVNGKLYEIPIYCENMPITKFFTINRIYRVLLSGMHNLGKSSSDHSLNEKKSQIGIINSIISKMKFLFGKHAWKMDFNQCTGKQLIDGLKRAEIKYKHMNIDLPFVLIGHSKLFTKRNEMTLKPFLRFVSENSNRFNFGTFKDIILENFRYNKY
jgi:hypothetical protein